MEGHLACALSFETRRKEQVFTMSNNVLDAMLGLILLFLVLPFLCVFFILRFRWWLNRRRFRPSYASLGNAFQQLQALAVPKIEHSLQEQTREKLSEDDDGGPDQAGKGSSSIE